jgi:hypothetical protein
VASAVAIRIEDEAPPQSGVRLRVLVDANAAEAAPPPSDARVVAEVAGEVLVEVWDQWRALSPLQGPWLGLRIAHAGAALLTAARWRHEGDHPVLCLRARWPELVPGFAAMNRLVGTMVDLLCA